jgi:hypothetical protein
MALNLSHLLNLVSPGLILQPSQGQLGCRPARSWQRFLLTVYNLHHDKKLCTIYLDSYASRFCLGAKLCTHQPGLAKNSPAPTLAATNLTGNR